jgi:hypothetical protein
VEKSQWATDYPCNSSLPGSGKTVNILLVDESGKQDTVCSVDAK